MNQDGSKTEKNGMRATKPQEQSLPLSSQTTGWDHGEPRKRCRLELGERADRFEQYDMVQDAEPSDVFESWANVHRSLAPPSVPKTDHAPEDTFESEFMATLVN